MTGPRKRGTRGQKPRIDGGGTNGYKGVIK